MHCMGNKDWKPGQTSFCLGIDIEYNSLFSTKLSEAINFEGGKMQNCKRKWFVSVHPIMSKMSRSNEFQSNNNLYFVSNDYLRHSNQERDEIIYTNNIFLPKCNNVGVKELIYCTSFLYTYVFIQCFIFYRISQNTICSKYYSDKVSYYISIYIIFKLYCKMLHRRKWLWISSILDSKYSFLVICIDLYINYQRVIYICLLISSD